MPLALATEYSYTAIDGMRHAIYYTQVARTTQPTNTRTETMNDPLARITAIVAGTDDTTELTDDRDALRDEIAELTDERDALLAEVEAARASLEQIEARTSNAEEWLDHVRNVVATLAAALDD